MWLRLSVSFSWWRGKNVIWGSQDTWKWVESELTNSKFVCSQDRESKTQVATSSVTRMVMGNLLCKNSTEASSLNKFWPFTYAVIAKGMQRNAYFKPILSLQKSKSLDNLDLSSAITGVVDTNSYNLQSYHQVKLLNRWKCIWVALISAFEIHKFPFVHSSVSWALTKPS